MSTAVEGTPPLGRPVVLSPTRGGGDAFTAVKQMVLDAVIDTMKAGFHDLDD